jgi:hypothetical protein
MGWKGGKGGCHFLRPLNDTNDLNDDNHGVEIRKDLICRERGPLSF